jgi:hypothetical protein
MEWLQIVHEVGDEAFSRALKNAVQQAEFFPSIKKIRDFAGLNEEKAASSEAEQAWLVVLEYLRKHGSEGMPVYRFNKKTGEGIKEAPPRLPDRIEYAVRLAGGLKVICATEEKDQHFRRDDFIKAYENYAYSERFPLQLPDSLRGLLSNARGSARPALPCGAKQKSDDPVGQPSVLTEDDLRRGKEVWGKVEAAAAKPLWARHRDIDTMEPSDEEKLRRRDEMLADLKAKGML